jgi:hypothetical protein
MGGTLIAARLHRTSDLSNFIGDELFDCQQMQRASEFLQEGIPGRILL